MTKTALLTLALVLMVFFFWYLTISSAIHGQGKTTIQISDLRLLVHMSFFLGSSTVFLLFALSGWATGFFKSLEDNDLQ